MGSSGLRSEAAHGRLSTVQRSSWPPVAASPAQPPEERRSAGASPVCLSTRGWTRRAPRGKTTGCCTRRWETDVFWSRWATQHETRLGAMAACGCTTRRRSKRALPRSAWTRAGAGGPGTRTGPIELLDGDVPPGASQGSRSCTPSPAEDGAMAGRGLRPRARRPLSLPPLPPAGYPRRDVSPRRRPVVPRPLRRPRPRAGARLAGDRGRPRRADQRAHRRRQDARGLPLLPRPARPRRGARRPRGPHGRPLHLAAEGALPRRPPQPRAADRRDLGGHGGGGPRPRRASGPSCGPATAPRRSGAPWRPGRHTCSSPRRSPRSSC